MSDEIKEKKIPLYLQELEAKELGRLIEEDKLADEESERLSNQGPLRKFLSGKKPVAFVLLAALIFFAGDWGLSWLQSQNETFVKRDNVGKGTAIGGKEKVKDKKPVIYKLDTFFLPLVKAGKESGKFLTVKAELILSDARVYREVELALPMIRQNIYALLKRKKLSDFLDPKKPVEERIKKEIIASTNTTLISGVGSIEDVFFSQFVVQ